jgi:hypothetical protein
MTTTATAPWPPVAVAPVLDRLRAPGQRRPAVDPGLAGGLREWLEDALAGPVGAVPDDVADLRVRKDALTQVLMCEGHFAASRLAPRVVTAELARGSLVDALFRQWVTVGQVDVPMADEVAPSEDRLTGKASAEYAKTLLAENKEKYSKIFSGLIRAGFKPEEYEKNASALKQAILKGAK